MSTNFCVSRATLVLHPESFPFPVMPVDKKARRMALDRQQRIIDALASILTDDTLTREELEHFQKVPFWFPHIQQAVDQLWNGEEGKPDLQREFAVSAIVALLRKLL